MKRWWLLGALLALFSCTKEEEAPVLRAIVPDVYVVSLSDGGSAEIPFRVDSPDYAFNYTVGGTSCQIRLLLLGGKEPQEYALKEVRALAEKGAYVAVVEDCGLGRKYDSVASLAISIGGGAFVRSVSITFRSDETSGGGMRTGLPTVYVNTENGRSILSKTTWVPATFAIQSTGSLPGLSTVSCSIRGRGNTTWTWPKKPYVVKLEQRTSVLGFPEHKRWILLANFMDRTLMRNMVSMKVAAMMSFLAWTPHCQSVELVLNGSHMGNYLLIEQVRVDKNRVNITEMKKTDVSGTAVTGGYLLELDFHYDNEVQWKDHGIPFAVKYPEPEDLTPQQKDYIKGYIAEVSAALYGNDFADPAKGYAKYLDVDSFIDYWIVFEVMCNHELGNPGSVYFHKDRGGKLFAGPCWDFDWGVLSFYTSGGDRRLVNRHAIWYDRLFQDPAFLARAKARLQEVLPQLQTIPDYMEECRALLKDSAFLNFQLWDPAGDASQNGGNIINGDENLSFDAAVDRLKANYTTHLQLILDTL